MRCFLLCRNDKPFGLSSVSWVNIVSKSVDCQILVWPLCGELFDIFFSTMLLALWLILLQAEGPFWLYHRLVFAHLDGCLQTAHTTAWITVDVSRLMVHTVEHYWTQYASELASHGTIWHPADVRLHITYLHTLNR